MHTLMVINASADGRTHWQCRFSTWPLWTLLVFTISLQLSAASPIQTSLEFNYHALNEKGDLVTGQLFASSETTAAETLRRQGLFPTRVSKIEPARRTRHQNNLQVPTDEVDTFFERLAVLTSNGISVRKALATIGEETNGQTIEMVLEALIDAVEKGKLLSDALANFPSIFEHAEVSQIRAGELGGGLGIATARINNWRTRKINAKAVVNRIEQCVLSASITEGMTCGLSIFLILSLSGPPIFQKLYGAIKKQWLVDWLAPVVCAIGAALLVTNKQLGNRLSNEVEEVSTLGAQSVAFHTLSNLLLTGVPILQAIQLTADDSENEKVRLLLADLKEEVRNGESVVGPLNHGGRVAALGLALIEHGEDTGQLPETLELVADHYQELMNKKVSHDAKRLSEKSFQFNFVFVSIALALLLVHRRRFTTFLVKQLMSVTKGSIGNARVFLCYRRSDSEDFTARVFNFLCDQSKKRMVFRDVDDIGIGDDINAKIHSALEKVDVILVIIGPKWCIDETTGLSRLQDTDDYVRLEIETALKLQKKVIPVLVRDTEKPSKKDLPPGMWPLFDSLAAIVRGDPNFRHDMNALCHVILNDHG